MSTIYLYVSGLLIILQTIYGFRLAPPKRSNIQQLFRPKRSEDVESSNATELVSNFTDDDQKKDDSLSPEMRNRQMLQDILRLLTDYETRLQLVESFVSDEFLPVESGEATEDFIKVSIIVDGSGDNNTPGSGSEGDPENNTNISSSNQNSIQQNVNSDKNTQVVDHESSVLLTDADTAEDDAGALSDANSQLIGDILQRVQILETRLYKVELTLDDYYNNATDGIQTTEQGWTPGVTEPLMPKDNTNTPWEDNGDREAHTPTTMTGTFATSEEPEDEFSEQTTAGVTSTEATTKRGSTKSSRRNFILNLMKMSPWKLINS